MKKVFITLFGMAAILGGIALATPEKNRSANSETAINIYDETKALSFSKQSGTNLWLPDGFSWDNKHHYIISKFPPHEVAVMPLTETEQGIYTGIMAGRTPVGYMFSFFEDKLVGICVAYEADYPQIPQIKNITTEKGYTKIYRSRAGICRVFNCPPGGWIFIESGLKGHKVFTWAKNLGIKSSPMTQ